MGGKEVKASETSVSLRRYLNERLVFTLYETRIRDELLNQFKVKQTDAKSAHKFGNEVLNVILVAVTSNRVCLSNLELSLS